MRVGIVASAAAARAAAAVFSSHQHVGATVDAVIAPAASEILSSSFASSRASAAHLRLFSCNYSPIARATSAAAAATAAAAAAVSTATAVSADQRKGRWSQWTKQRRVQQRRKRAIASHYESRDTCCFFNTASASSPPASLDAL